jgi:hypothetical protein
MESSILGSSDLPIIGENRWSRKWLNKTEVPNIVPMKQSKGLWLHLTENWAVQLIKKNSLTSTAHASQFRDKQTFHSSPKPRHPVSTEVLRKWPFIMWLQLVTLSA